MTRTVAAAILVVVALVFPVVAEASLTPVQRLTYSKAVSYWTTQAKAHGSAITCQPFDSHWPATNYGCVFGKTLRVEILANAKCSLTVEVSGPTKSVTGPNLTVPVGNVHVVLCKAGWQTSLPTPWNLPR